MRPRPVALPRPEAIEAIACDLDGVVYRGAEAVPHAVEALQAVSVPVRYLTNNASRPPEVVAEHLRRLGLPADRSQVLTSSQVGASALAERFPGGRVLAVGGPGVALALQEAGLSVSDSADGVDAVLQGYGADVTASHLAEAAYAIEAGAWWVATNTDATLPSDRGVAPGNGTLVAAVERAVGRPPDRVCGKPHPDLYAVAASRLGMPPGRILAIGDRLDTDIEGANRAGAPALLVLTGIDTRESAATAPEHQRPSVILDDLRGLHRLVPVSEPLGWDSVVSAPPNTVAAQRTIPTPRSPS